MTHLPQFIIAAWLATTVVVGIRGALFPPATRIVLNGRGKRLVAIGFIFTALIEAALLTLGGFWK